MEKLNNTMTNRLVSFERADQISKMTREQKLTFNNDVKKQAAYLMLSVSRAVENKDYKNARSILIYIADSCSCIEDPDSEVRYLIEVCCQHLAYIREMQTVVKDKGAAEARSEAISMGSVRKPIYVFRYNKFSGQFECDEDDKSHINQSVLFYMSKLNAILFNYQNTQNHHSIIGMLLVYYPYFIMVAIFIGFLFIIVFSTITQSLMGTQNNYILDLMPITLCSLLFIIPLLKIYTKKPVKKDSFFFQKRLGQQITKINKICEAKGQPLKFFMPEGIEINVEVKYESEY